MNRQVLLDSAQMREAERRTIAAGPTGLDLMRRAGEGAARIAATMLPQSGRAVVLCGPGSNGGDGFIVARELAAGGFRVDVASARPPDAMTGDAARAAADWTGPVMRFADADMAGADLVVDAIFGTGLSRDLDGEVADLVRQVNASGVPVLAIDLPSGIDADRGEVRGVAVKATRTVTFACRKPGHLLYPGRAHCGPVDVVEIGVAAATLEEVGGGLFLNEPGLWQDRLPRPGADGHKYDRGHALAISGSAAHTGAARLAARGALRAGAGLVSVVTSARALAVNAAQLTAIMLRVCDDPDEFSDLLTDDRFNALVLGPALGVGEPTRRWVEAALEADRATVLDADALTSFEGRAAEFASLCGQPREHPIVLTPHSGEFKRLFAGRDEPSADARAVAEPRSKLDRARRAAAFTGCAVVLKGADTVIAAPDGRAAINQNGSPYLATAGSGDVLGGIVAGLLAQGMPGFEAACAGVWLHAEAGSRFGPGLVAEDLPEGLPGVLGALFGGDPLEGDPPGMTGPRIGALRFPPAERS